MRKEGGWVFVTCFIFSMGPPWAGAQEGVIQPSYVYRGQNLRDPFVPIRAGQLSKALYIIDLRMTAIVSSGKTRIALFNKKEGPKTVYRLRYGRLLGNDGKPVPGITGRFLEGDPDACVLVQGDKEMVFRIAGKT